MSAFIVSKAHISAMLQAGLDDRDPLSWDRSGGNRYLNQKTADRVGQMLLDECVASVKHRYSDHDDLPGPVNEEWKDSYKFTAPGRSPTPVEALKLIACYEYQSCEHREWEESEAKELCQRLRHRLIYRLPGYEQAPWVWTEDRAQSDPSLVGVKALVHKLIKADGQVVDYPPAGEFYTLEEMQKAVGGYVQVVPMVEDETGSLLLIVNEEGKVNDLPVNREATRLFKESLFEGDWFAGDVLVAMNAGEEIR